MVHYDYLKQALARTKKPCAFLNMDALQKNMEAITKVAQNKKIRIASKSIRSVDVLKHILSSSPIFQGIMCFTAEEAIFLNEYGFNDLLIAYPIWDEQQLRDICNLVKKGATITVMVDCIEHIERLEMIALEENGKFLVCVDIDVSTNLYGLHFGVYRSPIKTVEDALYIIQRIVNSSYIKLDGLMGYEAQIAGVKDDDPNEKIRSTIIRMLKRRSSKLVVKKRQQIMEQIKKAGIVLRFVNGGGTGSLHETIKEASVTEVTVGSGFYYSHLFDKYEHFKLEVATGFAVEITRIPKENIYTCFGGGYVASGAVNQDKLPEIFLPQGATLTKNEGVGEVQTPIKYNGPIELQHGDPIIFRHSKAGELCERFHKLHIIKNGKIIDEFLTYRGEGKCFL